MSDEHEFEQEFAEFQQGQQGMEHNTGNANNKKSLALLPDLLILPSGVSDFE